VVNHGHSWFYSSQELALYTALLRHDTPDVVIFLDGYNDTWMAANDMPYFTPQAADGWESQRQKNYYGGDQPWVTFNPTFPPLHLIGVLQKRAVIPTEQQEATQAQMDAITEQILGVYRYNRTAMLALSETQDVTALMILQPLTTRYRTYAVADAVYEALATDAKTVAGFYDLSGNFKDEHFVDNAHYSDIGSQILAERIAALVLPVLKE
jgi:lysophospholipase L1-like esterase